MSGAAMVNISALNFFFLSEKIVNYTYFHMSMKQEQNCCHRQQVKRSYSSHIECLNGYFMFHNDTSYVDW